MDLTTILNLNILNLKPILGPGASGLVVMSDSNFLNLIVMQGLKTLDLACLSDSSKHRSDTVF